MSQFLILFSENKVSILKTISQDNLTDETLLRSALKKLLDQMVGCILQERLQLPSQLVLAVADSIQWMEVLWIWIITSRTSNFMTDFKNKPKENIAQQTRNQNNQMTLMFWANDQHHSKLTNLQPRLQEKKSKRIKFTKVNQFQKKKTKLKKR